MEDEKAMTEAENPRRVEPLAEVMEILATVSDDMLATPLAQECREFVKAEHTQEEKIRFLRDLRDKAVYYGGASTFVMHVFSALLDKHHESEIDRKARQAELEAGFNAG